jgi:uncharacterized protein (DUF2267 family)
VDYDGFLSTVEDVGQIPADQAERVACATLRTLSERISSGEAEDLAERLPRELGRCLEPERKQEPFHVDEFLRRVGERAQLDADAAERETRAVLAAVLAAVGPDEFADMRSELPRDFDPLLDDALRSAPPPTADIPQPPEALSLDAWRARVARRAHIDEARAQQAIEAVLEALASRITGGEIDDVEPLLPPALRPALERGRARSGARARPLSVDAFLDLVAELEGVDRGTAAESARAVMRTLREAIGEKEFHDIAEQLPGEYRMLWRAG